jgi:general secretion pathway protein J
VRDALGDPLPALRSDRRTQEIVALTRGGWSNTAGLPRGTLQRVTYRLQGDTLIRSYTTVLDITLANAPVERELLKGVNSVTLRFMDAGRQWQEQWPSLAAAPGAAAAGGGSTPPGFRSRPMAVEITIDLKDTGKIVRLVEVPS